MPHVATSPSDLLETLNGVAHLDGDRLVIDDETGFRGAGIRDLAWTAAFTTDDARQPLLRSGWSGRPARSSALARRASRSCTQPAVEARSPGSPCRPSTCAPRPSTWRARCSRPPRDRTSARSSSSWPAASRPTPTSGRSTTRRQCSPGRSPRTGGRPVFIQGDHYQFNAKKYAADPEAMTEEIRRACRLAIDAGYRNIDIDSSTLVDLSKPTIDEQQRENYVRAAELTAFIRTLETDGVTDQRRWRDRRGGPQELDRGGARGVPRRLPAGAGRACCRARPGSRR